MEPFIGTILMFAGNFAPRGWALCNGQLLAISSHSALFSILGTTYGGDGVSTFGLPELRGRVAIHEGTGPGLTPRNLGAKGGHETATLTTQQLPPHNHPLTASDEPPNVQKPETHRLAATNIYTSAAAVATMASDTVGNTGGGRPVDLMQPFQVVNFIIALEGLYPSRN